MANFNVGNLPINLIIFMLGQLTMFILWLVRMDATGTKAGKIIVDGINQRLEQLDRRIAAMEIRLNQIANKKLR
jgi:hypothetical protein